MEISYDYNSVKFCLAPTMLRSKAEKTRSMWAVKEGAACATVCNYEVCHLSVCVRVYGVFMLTDANYCELPLECYDRVGTHTNSLVFVSSE